MVVLADATPRAGGYVPSAWSTSSTSTTRTTSACARYVSDRAKIEPRRKSGVCAKHQRALSTAIKRARHLALLPFVPMQTMRSGIRR